VKAERKKELQEKELFFVSNTPLLNVAIITSRERRVKIKYKL